MKLGLELGLEVYIFSLTSPRSEPKDSSGLWVASVDIELTGDVSTTLHI